MLAVVVAVVYMCVCDTPYYISELFFSLGSVKDSKHPNESVVIHTIGTKCLCAKCV